MRRLGALAIVSLAAISCVSYPDSSTYYNSAIATQYDPKATFSAFSTFGLNPTINLIDANSNVTTQLDATTSMTLLNTVATNLTKRGYTQVDPAENPTMGVEITILKELRSQSTATPFYWWAGSSYPSYWGSSYYYPTYWITSSSYNVGAMVVQLFDTRNSTSTSGVPVIWGAIVYDIITGTTAANTQVAVSGINQAFVQSPYLAYMAVSL